MQFAFLSRKVLYIPNFVPNMILFFLINKAGTAGEAKALFLEIGFAIVRNHRGTSVSALGRSRKRVSGANRQHSKASRHHKRCAIRGSANLPPPCARYFVLPGENMKLTRFLAIVLVALATVAVAQDVKTDYDHHANFSLR